MRSVHRRGGNCGAAPANAKITLGYGGRLSGPNDAAANDDMVMAQALSNLQAASSAADAVEKAKARVRDLRLRGNHDTLNK